MARKLPAKGFPKHPVSFRGLVGTYMLDARDTAMRAAYNAGLHDALYEIGEYSKRGIPMAELMLERIRKLEKFV